MTYLFLGEDNDKKEEQIAKIKKETLLSLDAHKFDLEILYANKLPSDTLKKSLMSLPAVAEKRLVLLHTLEKLSPHNKTIIQEFVSEPQSNVVLILESGTLTQGDAFVKKIRPHVKVIDSLKATKVNVFDMTRAMTSRRSPEALKILHVLFHEGIHPLQIMGGLVWFWGKTRVRLSSEKFEKGLLFLQEADLNIKRSRLKAEYTLEILIVQLCTILT